MNNDLLGHLIRQHVASMMATQARPVYGHVAEYDPMTHKAKVIVPSCRDPDTGSVVTSPWIPFGSSSAGALGGLQYHPQTGATVSDLTAGEQVQIGFFDQSGGVSAAPCFHFNEATPPPAASLPSSDPVAPGELLIAIGGGVLRLRPTGRVSMYSATEVDVGNSANPVYVLMDQRALQVLVNHTHAGGPKMDQPLVVGQHTTTVLKAN